MTLKKFLKPDWRKIVLTVILFSLIFVVGSICNFLQEICSLQIIQYIKAFLLLPHIFIFFLLGNMNWFLLAVLFFISSIIYYYLLSSIIVWLYDKFRKPKK